MQVGLTGCGAGATRAAKELVARGRSRSPHSRRGLRLPPQAVFCQRFPAPLLAGGFAAAPGSSRVALRRGLRLAAALRAPLFAVPCGGAPELLQVSRRARARRSLPPPHAGHAAPACWLLRCTWRQRTRARPDRAPVAAVTPQLLLVLPEDLAHVDPSPLAQPPGLSRRPSPVGSGAWRCAPSPRCRRGGSPR
jgi:hypothetical protein